MVLRRMPNEIFKIQNDVTCNMQCVLRSFDGKLLGSLQFYNKCNGFSHIPFVNCIHLRVCMKHDVIPVMHTLFLFFPFRRSSILSQFVLCFTKQTPHDNTIDMEGGWEKQREKVVWKLFEATNDVHTVKMTLYYIIIKNMYWNPHK